MYDQTSTEELVRQAEGLRRHISRPFSDLGGFFWITWGCVLLNLVIIIAFGRGSVGLAFGLFLLVHLFLALTATGVQISAIRSSRRQLARIEDELRAREGRHWPIVGI